MKRLLEKWFQIRADERRREHHLPNFPFFPHSEKRKRGDGKLRRFGIGLAEHPHPDGGGDELPQDWIERKSGLTEKELRAFMAEKYGPSVLREGQMAELERKLCTGNHENCHLHITKGGTAEMHIRNAFEALQKQHEEAQIAHNREVFHRNEARNRAAIAKLTEKIQNSVLLYLQPYTVRADSGGLEAGRVWRAVHLNDSHVFRKTENLNAGDVSVDILLDASTSQKGRLESISGQAFCIAEALTRCRIPCSVTRLISLP